MKRSIITALLLAVLLKMVYNLYSFIYNVHFNEVERAMRIALIALLTVYLLGFNRKNRQMEINN
jgi:hypothetical protein